MKEPKQIDFQEKLATLVVAGTERPINAAIYGEDAQLVLTDAFPTPPAEFSGRGREPYRAALVVQDNAIQENMSVRPALVGGTVTDTEMDGVTVRSTTDDFSHVIVDNAEFTIRNCDLSADTASDGKHVCDFNGYGSLLSAFRGAKLTVENCKLSTRGVAKTVLFADGGSNCLMRNCTYSCHGGTLYAGYQNTAGFSKMVAPPWVLGIPGSARGTNLMGTLSTMAVVNCDCHADGWGVLSTDGGKEMALYVVDSKITLDKATGPADNPFIRRYGAGYGVYAAGTDEFFYGAEFRVGTYAIIAIGGSSITLASSKCTVMPKQKYLVPTGKYQTAWDGHNEEICDVHWHDTPVFEPIKGQGKPTVIHSDGWGFMFHGNSSLRMLDGTICNTDYATFLIRSVGVEIQVDNSHLNPGDGVILQMIDNDDKAVGGRFTPDIYDDDGNLVQPHIGPIFNHEYFEHPGYPGIDYQTECKSSGETVSALFTNCHLNGNLYNATGYRNFGDGPNGQGEVLNVTLGENATLSGIISATTSMHVDEKGRPRNLFTENEYYYLGHVCNEPYDNGVNHVNVTLESNAKWTVTGRCLLNMLDIGQEAQVLAREGERLRVLLDGQEISLLPGNRYVGGLDIEVIKM